MPRGSELAGLSSRVVCTPRSPSGKYSIELGSISTCQIKSGSCYILSLLSPPCSLKQASHSDSSVDIQPSSLEFRPNAGTSHAGPNPEERGGLCLPCSALLVSTQPHSAELAATSHVLDTCPASWPFPWGLASQPQWVCRKGHMHFLDSWAFQV